jgi:SagB-type dehydrogenase family enzyme
MTFVDMLRQMPKREMYYVLSELTWAADDDSWASKAADAIAASGAQEATRLFESFEKGPKAYFEKLVGDREYALEPAEPDEEITLRVEELRLLFAEKEARSERLKEAILRDRALLKANFDDLDQYVSDQMMGFERPSAEKEASPDATIIALPHPDRSAILDDSLWNAMCERRSVRAWKPGRVSKAALSFMLWATQGKRSHEGPGALRTVPSGGARHPFETYLVVRDVEGIAMGVWRYRPLEHDLVLIELRDDLSAQLSEAACDQEFVGLAPVTFVWTAVPYRTEWRYLSASNKIILQDSGHLCQNLYLAATACGLGTCAIGAYSQAAMDGIVCVDGVDEFVVYCAPVGVPAEESE